MYSASPRFARPSRQEQVPSSHRADDLQVNIIVLLIVINELSKSFGRGVGTTLGLIFLGFIFWPILAFGSAQYQGGGAAAA